MSPRSWTALCLAAAALGCPGPKPGGPDAAMPTDAGMVPDASVDGGPIDAGQPDGSVPDGGLVDAGDGGRLGDGGLPNDGGLSDAGDGGTVDSGPPPITFSAQVIDFCNNYSPLAGAQVSLVGGSASAFTDSQGNYTLPVPAGLPFTQQLQLAGYQTAYVGEVTIQSDVTVTVTQIPLVCNSLYQSLINSFSNFDTSEGVILAKVDTLASSGACTDQSGWSFQIAPSGAETYLYFDVTDSPDPTLTATKSYGIGAIYNIAASRVLLSAAKPDAGCTNAGSQVGLTGYVDLAPGILSYGGYFIE